MYYDFDGNVRLPFRPNGLAVAESMPTDLDSFVDPTLKPSPPSQRALSTVVHHEAWCALFDACLAVDAARDRCGGPGAVCHREACRLISASADHAGAWLNVQTATARQRSAEWVLAAQRRAGLYLSAASAYCDARAAAGHAVSDEERLRMGDTFAHRANHSTAHKWVCVAWRQAIANSTTATVFCGDRKLGKAQYQQYCASYVPDIVTTQGADGGLPEIHEVKNYSPFVHASTNHPACTALVGQKYPFGNTSERLNHKVLGTRQRGLPAQGRFCHQRGTGFVPYHAGDYVDALKNKKATVQLLVHETLGGMCPFSARRLRRLARDAAASGCDATDYSLSSTARSFVPFYAQRISSAIVMNGARSILDGIARARNALLRRPA